MIELESNSHAVFEFAPVSEAPLSEVDACEEFAERILAEWKGGGSIDALGALRKYSILQRHQSLAIDLAYEEFCLRHERGEKLDIASFCSKFPDIRRSLEKQIEFHKLIEDNPDVLNGFSEPVWPSANSTFLGFKIRKEIGRGAFARVYLANETALGDREVVVKVSTIGSTEANTLGKLDHPGIVPVHSVVEDMASHLTAMCMPSLGELTLHELAIPDGGLTEDVKRKSLSALKLLTKACANPETLHSNYRRAVLTLITKLAEALSFAHKAGIFHLDLKPSNVLITNDGTPMLLDFNLSHDASQGTSRMGGTLPYMAPEQLAAFLDNRHNLPPVGAHSDTFGLGVMLFQLLTGKLPFPAPASPSGSLHDSALNQLECQRQGVGEHIKAIPGIPGSLRSLIFSCLEFDVSLRPSSMQSVAEQLRAHLTPSRRVSDWIIRKRRVLVASGILCLAIPFITVDRPAYHSRLASRAILKYRNREFDGVIEQTSRILTSDKSDHNALILQSLAFAQKREYIRAMQNFKLARPNITDARILAIAAHCFAVSKHHDDAIGWYTDAIEAGLRANANVHNNLGFSLMQRGRLEEAIYQFNEALVVAPNHTATLHNYALAELKLATRTNEFSPKAIALIEQAMATSEPSAELSRDAAWIYAWAEREYNFPPGGAVKHLRNAVQLGLEKESITQDPTLSCYLHDIEQDLTAPHGSNVKVDQKTARRVSDHKDLLLQIDVGDLASTREMSP